MAALLHQAARPAAKPHPWPLNSTSSFSPLHRAPLSKRLRASARRLQAATDSGSISTGAAAPPPPKKVTRKEKQLDRRRQQEMQQRQEQLVMESSSPSPAKPAGGSRSNSSSSDKYGGGGGDEDELPQPVFDRILRRIMVTVGVPMASGVALLSVYDALKRGQGVEVPSWLPLLTTLVAFGTSALGIAYGMLSASWDPDREGSLLGIDEARANWPVLWEEEIEKEKAKAKQKKK